ncbi:hypothetical protein Vretimale_8983, partial [Volvox reticuliferus]
ATVTPYSSLLLGRRAVQIGQPLGQRMALAESASGAQRWTKMPMKKFTDMPTDQANTKDSEAAAHQTTTGPGFVIYHGSYGRGDKYTHGAFISLKPSFNLHISFSWR